MEDIAAALAALGVLVVPLVLAWWLLGRGAARAERREAEHRREKMPR